MVDATITAGPALVYIFEALVYIFEALGKFDLSGLYTYYHVYLHLLSRLVARALNLYR